MEKFRFQKTESKINDLLLFPEVVMLKDFKEDDLSNYANMVSQEIIERFLHMKSLLDPFTQRIKKFYFIESSMAHFFRCPYPFFGYHHAKDYFERLKQLDERQVREAILAYLHKKESFLPFSDDCIEAIQPYLSDANLLAEFIDSVVSEDEEKWKMMMLLRRPLESLREWIELLEELEPMFESLYAPYEESIATYGENLVKRLNENTQQALAEITNNMVEYGILPEGDVLISCINITSIIIYANDRRVFSCWGLEAEATLAKVKELQRETQLERIVTFKNLGDKTRYEVLMCIANGMQSLKDIATKLQVSSATISYHINNLTTGKLIRIVHEGDKQYLYKVNEEWIAECYEGLIKDMKIQ